MLKHAPIHASSSLLQTGSMRGRGIGETLLHILQEEGVTGLFRYTNMACLNTLCQGYVHGLPSYMKHRAKSIMVYGSKFLSSFLARSMAPVCPSCYFGCHPSVSAAYLPWERIKALALACLSISSHRVHQAEYSFKQAQSLCAGAMAQVSCA